MHAMNTTIANMDLNLADRLAAFRTGVHLVFFGMVTPMSLGVFITLPLIAWDPSPSSLSRTIAGVSLLPLPPAALLLPVVLLVAVLLLLVLELLCTPLVGLAVGDAVVGFCVGRTVALRLGLAVGDADVGDGVGRSVGVDDGAFVVPAVVVALGVVAGSVVAAGSFVVAVGVVGDSLVVVAAGGVADSSVVDSAAVVVDSFGVVAAGVVDDSLVVVAAGVVADSSDVVAAAEEADALAICVSLVVVSVVFRSDSFLEATATVVSSTVTADAFPVANTPVLMLPFVRSDVTVLSSLAFGAEADTSSASSSAPEILSEVLLLLFV